jgi:GAF domain-containing protein
MTDQLENLRQELDTAYRQLEQTASRLLLINQAGLLTTTTHDERTIGRELLASILDSVFATSGLVVTYSDDGELFDIIARQGVPDEALGEFKQSDVESTAFWVASLRGRPLTREMIREDEEWESGTPPPAFAVYVPLQIEEKLIGALAVGDKSDDGEYDTGELSFLTSLGHHAALALNHARLYTRLEKKLHDLDTLLKVSHEITSTLDRDRVLKTIVTMASALSEQSYCAIGTMRGRKVQIDALGGDAPKGEEKKSLEALLGYVALSETEVFADVRELPEGEGRDLLRRHFELSGQRSFWGIPLKDEQGVMGAYSQLSTDHRPPEEEREILRIMANQASIAVRNAELYQQVPFIHWLEPLLERRRKLWAAGRRRLPAIALSLAVLLVMLLVVRPAYRSGGQALVYPGRRLELRAPLPGVVGEVYAREGQVVGPEIPVARIRNLDTELLYRELLGELDRARSEEAAARGRGDHFAAQQAASDRLALTGQLEALRDQLEAAEMAPLFPAVVLTPRIEELRGTFLAAGELFCEVGALDSLRIELALPERDWTHVAPGQLVRFKFHAYADRIFTSRVEHLAPVARTTEDGGREMIVYARIPAPDGLLPGMTGVGRVELGRRSLAWFLLRPLNRLFSRYWWY